MALKMLDLIISTSLIINFIIISISAECELFSRKGASLTILSEFAKACWQMLVERLV